MILRNYRGKEKRVGRQQVSSMLLMSAVKRISQNFCILKEARREVLEDLMDRENAMNVLKGIEQGKIRIEEIQTSVPSPFAFNLVLMGQADIMKIDDKIEFLRRMHQSVLARVYLKKGKEKKEAFDYHKEWEEAEERKQREKEEQKQGLKMMVGLQTSLPAYLREDLLRMIDNEPVIRQDVINELRSRKKELRKSIPEELYHFISRKIDESG